MEERRTSSTPTTAAVAAAAAAAVASSDTNPFFDGPIEEALTLARASRGKVLLVSLQHHSSSSSGGSAPPTGDQQQQLQEEQERDSRRLDAETWTDPEVQRRLAETAVALRLDWRSPAGAQFLAIYPAFRVPTVYLISPQTGQPAGLFVGFVTPQQLLAQLDEWANAASPSQSAQAVAEAQSAATAANAPPTPVQTEEKPTVTQSNDPMNETNETVPSLAPSSPPTGSLDAAAQKERFLKKLDDVKKRKAEEDEKNQKERELARRRDGRAALETVKKIEEVKRHQELEERKREKAAAQRHKEMVREKIRRDKELRAKQQQQQQEQHQWEQKAVGTATTTTYSSAALAFRMPDGSVEKAEFPALTTLAQCMQHLRNVAGLGDGFTLMINFPRRLFSVEDYSSTIRDLGLCPSATLIVTRSVDHEVGASTGPTTAASSGSGFLSGLASYISSFFLGSRQPSEPAFTSVNRNETPTRVQSRSGGNNVHGLQRDDGGDEPQGYWNGNSTQLN